MSADKMFVAWQAFRMPKVTALMTTGMSIEDASAKVAYEWRQKSFNEKMTYYSPQSQQMVTQELLSLFSK